MQTIKDSIKTIIISLIGISLVGLAFAWTEPTSTPPNGNVSAPITVGSLAEPQDQIKFGALGVDALDVVGGIRLGSLSDCNANIEGTIKYDSSAKTMKICNGTSWKAVAIAVDPPTVAISASQTSIAGEQSSILTWTSTDAVSCLASGGSGGWSGSKAASGNETVTPSATATYTLTCTNSTGSGSSSATVTVRLPAVTFSASANPIAVGQSTTLIWSSTDATSCAASGDWTGSKSLSGSQSVTPESSTTYTLTCTSTAGSDSKSTAMDVRQWRDTTGSGNVNESCDAWLERTGQAGVNGSAPRGGTFDGKCVYVTSTKCMISSSNLISITYNPTSYKRRVGECGGNGAYTRTRR